MEKVLRVEALATVVAVEETFKEVMAAGSCSRSCFIHESMIEEEKFRME